MRFRATLLALGALLAFTAGADAQARPPSQRTGPITITGSGSTGDGSGFYVVPAEETQSQSLKDIFTNARSAESFGAKGDGATDDTAAFAKLSAWMGRGKGRHVHGRPGAVYLVNNWVWPDQDGNGFTCASECTVRARNGGDADYLMATSRYVSNTINLDAPINIRNVRFDAAGIKAKACVIQTYFSRFEHANCDNSTGYGWYLGATTRNGTLVQGPGTTGVENKWIESGATGNSLDGILNTKYTDGWILGGTWHDNGGTSGSAGYNINLTQSAGWFVQYVHTYSVTALASSKDIYFANLGYASTFSNNYIEGIVQIDGLEQTSNSGSIGPGNTFNGGVKAAIGNNGPTTLTSFGNSYKFNTGQITHQYLGADHVIRSVNDTFDAAVPFAWNNSGSPGIIRAENSYSKGLNGTLNGDYTGGSFVVPGELKITKVVSTGTTDTVTVTAVLSKDVAITPAEIVIDLYGSMGSSGYTNVDAFSVQAVGVASRQYQSVNGAAAASVTRSVFSSNRVSAAASATTTGGTADQTVSFVVTITHPAASDAASGFIKAVARIRGNGMKAVSIQ